MLTPSIPGYKIKTELGYGGMSRVYLAEQESLQREVALKVMYSHYADIADYTRRFLRDGRAAAGLNHRRIVSIYDMGVVDQQFYIAMEFLPGGTLRDKIKMGLTAAQSLQIIKQIAEALAYAHQQGFVHRDIKPMNILFRGDGYAVLTDFGIAKQAGVESTSMTMVGTVLGSPKYMSPEQAHGDTVDYRSDIYSLGIVLYEMLTGTVPYDSASAIDIVMKHLNAPLPVLPPHLRCYQFLVSKMMAKDAANRPQSADELLELLSLAISRDNGFADGSADDFAGNDNTLCLTKQPGHKKAKPKPSLLSGKTRVLSAALVLLSLASSSRFFAADWRVEDLANPFTNSFAQVRQQSEPPPEKYTVALTLPAPKTPAAADSSVSAGLTAAQYQQLALHSRGKNLDASLAYVQQGLEKYPQYGGLQKLKYELDQERNIRELLRKADQLRAQNLLTYPAGNNVLEVYRRILALDSGNSVAAQGILAIAEHFKKLAAEAFKRQEYQQSLTLVENGLKAVPDHQPLLKLRTVVAPKAALEEKKMGSLLAQAEQLLSIFPLTDHELTSAWQKFQIVQQHQKDNPRVAIGLARIASEYHKLAKQAFAEDRFKEAMQFIRKGQQAHAGNAELAYLQEKVVANLSR